MTYLWPSMLYALGFIPVLIFLYVLIQRQRIKRVANLKGLISIKHAKKTPSRLVRQIPPFLFVISLCILVLALARPQTKVNLPRVEGTLILVFDVSGSMAAKDAEPTRMEAAKTAAQEIILNQPETVQIGIVSFSNSGFTVQNPTNDTQSLLDAINRLQPGAGTSLGQGILTALNTIATDSGLYTEIEGSSSEQSSDQSPQPEINPETDLLSQLSTGIYPSSVIVILSDGENNESLNPQEAAQAAADRGVHIDALGFGTTAGVVLEVDGFNIHTSLDESALREISQVAGGTYYNIQNEPDLQAVYKNISPELVIKSQMMEVTSIFAGAGIFFALMGAICSLFWFSQLP
ncbi:MAG: hypothetical protein CVU39_17210 [Chloroflexi bacterium HGW-Chloroflexi-10]|nr:MAG: hypothetical protein CVU39_17210 [Chloroflexi bacterium HGW-Chloroflexi-10]